MHIEQEITPDRNSSVGLGVEKVTTLSSLQIVYFALAGFNIVGLAVISGGLSRCSFADRFKFITMFNVTLLTRATTFFLAIGMEAPQHLKPQLPAGAAWVNFILLDLGALVFISSCFTMAAAQLRSAYAALTLKELQQSTTQSINASDPLTSHRKFTATSRDQQTGSERKNDGRENSINSLYNDSLTYPDTDSANTWDMNNRPLLQDYAKRYNVSTPDVRKSDKRFISTVLFWVVMIFIVAYFVLTLVIFFTAGHSLVEDIGQPVFFALAYLLTALTLMYSSVLEASSGALTIREEMDKVLSMQDNGLDITIQSTVDDEACASKGIQDKEHLRRVSRSRCSLRKWGINRFPYNRYFVYDRLQIVAWTLIAFLFMRSVVMWLRVSASGMHNILHTAEAVAVYYALEEILIVGAFLFIRHRIYDVFSLQNAECLLGIYGFFESSKDEVFDNFPAKIIGLLPEEAQKAITSPETYQNIQRAVVQLFLFGMVAYPSATESRPAEHTSMAETGVHNRNGSLVVYEDHFVAPSADAQISRRYRTTTFSRRSTTDMHDVYEPVDNDLRRRLSAVQAHQAANFNLLFKLVNQVCSSVHAQGMHMESYAHFMTGHSSTQRAPSQLPSAADMHTQRSFSAGCYTQGRDPEMLSLNAQQTFGHVSTLPTIADDSPKTTREVPDVSVNMNRNHGSNTYITGSLNTELLS